MREKHGKGDVHIHSELAVIYADTETDRAKDKSKSGSRDEPIHGQSVTILPKTDRGTQREDREKHESRNVHIHVK